MLEPCGLWQDRTSNREGILVLPGLPEKPLVPLEGLEPGQWAGCYRFVVLLSVPVVEELLELLVEAC